MKTDSESQELYSSIANVYDLGLRVFGYRRAAKAFVKMLPFEANDSFSVLDAGAGTGLYSFAILSRFPRARITAFDRNPAMLERMRDNALRQELQNAISTLEGDVVQRLPIGERSYDLIVTGGVLEYVDVGEAVKNLTTHLRSGGYFLHSPVRDSWLGRLLGRAYGFEPHTQAENIEPFLAHGFVLTRTAHAPLLKDAHLFRKL